MDIISLIFGFLIGVIFILSLVSLLIFISNRRFLKNSMQKIKVDNQVIRDIISKKQKRMIKSPQIGINNNFKLIQELTKEVIYDIASYYYPNSKNPHLEINFIEALDMNERITERLKSILNVKVISLLKNIRIAQIINLLETKKNLESNSIYKFSKKYRLDKVVSYGYTALNITNPAYWVRKIIFTSTLETTLRSIAVMTLNIVGEEASNLYSKKIINNSDKIMEKELNKFIKEIEMSS